MLIIHTTTKQQDDIRKIIRSIDRLEELVIVTNNPALAKPVDITIAVGKDIKSGLDWHDSTPPYLFPPVPLTKENLLALVFYHLGNQQRAFEFLNSDHPLFQHLAIAANLRDGYPITGDMLRFLEQASSWHNLAIVHHYGGIADPDIRQNPAGNYYQQAMQSATTDSLLLFTIKHYTTLLIDSGLVAEAEKLLRPARDKAVNNAEGNALDQLLAAAMMAQLTPPYNHEKLAEISHLQLNCINYYEANDLPVQAGLLLIEASEVANFKNDYATSKKLIEKAVRHFQQEEQTDLLGEALVRKATLLYTWSKNGSPQYYKPAINTLQSALKIFKKDRHPQRFADIHHQLALIYSEIPVSADEKPLWAAFCASSFKEALSYYTHEQYPYEYAMVCHNYATALMGFPEARKNNNHDKAFGLFEEALKVRTASKFPLERALTLLNQLELYWLIHNENQAAESERYAQMQAKAEEIAGLVREEDLLRQADAHLEKLAELKIILE